MTGRPIQQRVVRPRYAHSFWGRPPKGEWRRGWSLSLAEERALYRSWSLTPVSIYTRKPQPPARRPPLEHGLEKALMGLAWPAHRNRLRAQLGIRR